MTIKNAYKFKREMIVELLFLGICVSLFFVSCVDIWAGLFLAIYFCVWFIFDALYFFRTFQLNENGCVIHFMGYKKTYKWEELKTRRVEYFARSQYGGCGFYGWVILSPYNMRKRKYMSAISYTCFKYLHPFSFIKIDFECKQKKKSSLVRVKQESKFWRMIDEKGERHRQYIIAEDLLMPTLQKWNVEIEVPIQKKWY